MTLNELRYDSGRFAALDEDDAIVVFRGNVYPVYMNDSSEENVLSMAGLLLDLCSTFDGAGKRFCNPDGTLKDAYLSNRSMAASALRSFEGFPGLLFGYVTEYDGDYALSFDFSSYDAANSTEMRSLMRTDIPWQFGYILFNGEAYTPGQVMDGDFRNAVGKGSNVAPLAFHGTTDLYLSEIMSKGIRQKRENSIFGFENKGYVYLTSVYESALNYARMYVSAKGGRECVLEVDTGRIDRNRMVLDHDFAAEFTTDISGSPYDGRVTPRGVHYKGDVARNSSDNGTKYGKFGYRGTVMPGAIIGAYVMTENGMEYMKADELRARYGTSGLVKEEKSSPVYYGLFLDDASIDTLLQIVPEGCSRIYCDHMTIVYRTGFTPQTVGYCEEHMGETFSMKATHIGASEDVMAVRVETDCISSNGVKHITLCTLNDRARPVQSNYITDWRTLDEPLQLRGVLRSYPFDMMEDKKYVRQDIMLGASAADACMEGAGRIDEMDSEDIDLKSFKVQDELNPKFWIDGKLNSRVRLKLLDLADEFYDSLNIKWVKPKDIVLTGSIANYNWSRYSDVDVHILVDYKDVWKKTDFVQDYFDSKKQLWCDEHKGLKIYGFPVEIYVEDSNADNPSSGIYSLEKNEWVREPDDFQDAKINEEYVKRVSARYITEIEETDELLSKEKDSHKLEVLSRKMKKLFDKLHRQRKESLEKHGEMGTYNIVWKVLRRSGYLDRIWEIVNTVYNKVNSIKESVGVTICIDESQVRSLREAMDDTFSFDELDKIKGFYEMKSYCEKHLGEPIGNGSSRLVFQIDDERVLKVAYNEHGIQQNKVEAKTAKRNNGLLPYIYRCGKGFRYLLSEYVLEATAEDVRHCLGMEAQKFFSIIDDIGDANESRSGYMAVSEHAENDPTGTIDRIYDYVRDNDIPVDDMTFLGNWGLTRRNGKEVLVLLDSGWNRDTKNMYYPTF